MTPLLHYTLNTGHSQPQPRSSVSEEVILALRPVVQSAGGPLPDPFSAFYTQITIEPSGGCTYSIWRAKQPLIMCALAWSEPTASNLFDLVEKMYLDLSDQFPVLFTPLHEPKQPATLPWLAVLILPQMALTTSRSDIAWLGDFERSLAWSILSLQ